MTLIYLASPIDSVNDDKRSAIQSFRDVVTAWAADNGHIVYQPHRAFSIGKNTPVSPDIRYVNDEVVRYAGALVAFAPAGVPSWGVPLEVDLAARIGKPTFVLTDKVTWSMVAGHYSDLFFVDYDWSTSQPWNNLLSALDASVGNGFF